MNLKRITLLVLLISVVAAGMVFGQSFSGLGGNPNQSNVPSGPPLSTNITDHQYRINAVITNPRGPTGEITIINNSNIQKTVVIEYTQRRTFVSQSTGKRSDNTSRQNTNHITVPGGESRRWIIPLNGNTTLVGIKFVVIY